MKKIMLSLILITGLISCSKGVDKINNNDTGYVSSINSSYSRYPDVYWGNITGTNYMVIVNYPKINSNDTFRVHTPTFNCKTIINGVEYDNCIEMSVGQMVIGHNLFK